MDRKLKFILAFLILCQFIIAFPEQLIINGNKSIIKGSLNAQINPIGITCAENPCIVKHNITIVNERNENISVALYRKEDDKFILMTVLGNLSADEIGEFEVPIIYQYGGLTTYIGRYLLISDNYLAKEFTIAESWRNYEKSAYETLNIGAYIVSPIIALILLFIIFIVIRDAESRKYGKKDEYTDKTLFEFPHGETVEEQVANAMTNPILWSIILFLAVLMICIITFSTYQDYDMMTKLEIIIISLIAATLVPLLLMIFTWYADIYEREPLRFVVGMFIYGIFAAMIAFFLNNIIIYLSGKQAEAIPLALTTAIISLVISPIIEEFLKIFGLALISRHHEFDDALDGLLYGFAIGLGFAMYENWFYFVINLDPIRIGIEEWTTTVVYRSLFNTIAHACFVAFAGVIIGYLKSREKYREFYYIGLIPGIFIAIILHVIFNVTAYLDIIGFGGYRAIIAAYNPSFVTMISLAFIITYIVAAIDTKRTKTSQQ
ncbi:MAG: PrsW family intramembrane metalloprotease [Candidatus Micrarchaeota archaeon]|nr:PrsW family intramembrane metalloprotease [Candidatus Micrarchaeota archaeon]